MNFLVSRLFWGGILICWGLVLILEKTLQINIPFTRFILAFLLIYGGVYLITRQNKVKKINFNNKFYRDSEYVFDKTNKEYNIIFGSSIIDLSKTTLTDKPIKINTIFGSSDVYISETESYEINVNTFFGETILPNKKESNFGSTHYSIGNNESNKISIEVNTIFGSSHIILKKSEANN